ncbi:hypothetical protein [Amycolatopsis pithecellobii]|uniref:hypothetical protein n=1 Tax=Amycolatopsis pithecellobii TaxID=664692 RepID=UPI0012B76B97|nr:hypothetical protein [Amycolatopsis pithecellobii]
MIKSVKAGPFEMQFEQGLQQASQEIGKAAAESIQSGVKPEPSPRDQESIEGTASGEVPPREGTAPGKVQHDDDVDRQGVAGVFEPAQVLDDFWDEVVDALEASPWAGAMLSFSRLEQYLQFRLGCIVQDKKKNYVPLGYMIKLAGDRGLFEPGELNALREVVNLRNSLVHPKPGDGITLAQALRYSKLVKQLIVAAETNLGRTNFS